MDKEKVKLMCKITIEDKKGHIKSRNVIGVGLIDYLFINCFNSFLAYTISFIILCVGYVVARFDSIMVNLMNINLADIFWVTIAIYIIGLVIYLFISIIFYYNRYKQKRKFIINNNKRIKYLINKFY